MKDFIIRCIEESRGDDYERAKRAFQNCTPKEMREAYGASSMTRQEILDGYAKRNKKITDAINHVKQNL